MKNLKDKLEIGSCIGMKIQDSTKAIITSVSPFKGAFDTDQEMLDSIQKIIFFALKSCEKMGLTSIAFVPFSTDGGRIPIISFANVFADAVTDYLLGEG